VVVYQNWFFFESLLVNHPDNHCEFVCVSYDHPKTGLNLLLMGRGDTHNELEPIVFGLGEIKAA
jgi:hypothetical protein